MPYTSEPAAEYEFRCIGSITCDLLDDRHGRECERVNQEAREEFYADIVLGTPLGDLR